MHAYNSPDGLLKIVSFPQAPQYDKFIAEIEDFRRQILTLDHRNDSNTISNYSPENFVLDRQAGFSIAYFKEQMIAFSSMFVNGEYYPENSVRLLNRFYIAPSTRSHVGAEPGAYKSRNRSPVIGPLMLAQQANLAKDLEFEWGFVSREMSNLRWTRLFCDAIGENSPYRWKVLPQLAALCQVNSPRCWHHIIFSNLKNPLEPKDIRFKNEKSIDSYRALFGPNAKNRL